jgi:tetratricopeptide (TPR) repeat protein
VAPGELSALLAELARLPTGDPTTRGPSLGPGALVGGRFELVRELGRGGFGGVWEALDLRLRRAVALKILRGRRGRGPALGEQEAEAVARLAHPNIVQIHDAGSAEAGPYLVLELLGGETLEARLERGPLPRDEALTVAIEIAKALAHAHGLGVLHRDLKPSNVFLTRAGGVKVLDFGLAQLLGGRPAPAGGTPGYMSPEQRRGDREDGRSDVYALGVLLYRMLAGRMPFARDADEAHAPGPPADVAPELADLVVRMLSRDPGERPRDGRAVLSELLHVLDVEGIRIAGREPEGVPWRAAAGLAAAALAAAAVALALRRPEVPEPPAGERLLVAVADVANETGDRDLDALSGLLITSLEQSRRLAVLTRSRMLDLARQLGRPRVERVGEPLGREIARAAGARALLVATVHRFDDVYTMDLRAVEPGRDTYLFSVKASASGRGELPALVDRISDEARLALREREADLAASRTKVAESITPSLEAYRHFFEAEQVYGASFDAAGALAAYKRALAADPTFALPHLAIAVMAEWHEAPEEDPAAHLTEAARQAHRLPDKERRLILAWKAFTERRFDDARALFRELVEAYPMEVDALYLAGETFWHAGAGGGAEEAAAHFRRALDLDPTYLEAMIHLMQWAARRGEPQEALQRARNAFRIRPEPMTLSMVARAHGFAGDLEAALREARRASELAGGRHFEVSWALAEVLWVAGRREEAEAELRRWIGPDASNGQRRLALEALPVALAAEGRRREALLAFGGLAGTGCDRRCDTFDETMKLHLLLAGGDAEAARAELARWDPPDEVEAEPHLWLWPWLGLEAEGARRAARLAPGSLWERRHAGAAALRRGDAGEAVRILSDLAPRDPAVETEFLLGQALLAAGRDREALAPLAEVADTYPLYAPRWQASFRAWSLLLLARTHARLGERAAARTRLAALLDVWRRADAELPLLADARRLARELGVPAR